MAAMLTECAELLGKSSKEHNKSAMKKFHAFIALYKHDFPERFPNGAILCEEDYIDEDFVSRVMKFLQSAKKWSTANGALGYILTELQTRYPNNREFIAENRSHWNEKMRRFYSTECAASRTKLVDHHMHVTRFDNSQICKYAFEHDLHEHAMLQAADFHNCGRINEAKMLECTDFGTCIEFTEVFSKACLTVDWFHSKGAVLTSTHQILQRSDWMCCVYHCLARLIILSPNPSPLLFPNLSRTNLVHTLNNLIRDCVQNFERNLPPAPKRTFAPMLTRQTMSTDKKGGAHLTSHGNRGGSKDIANRIRYANFQATDARMGLSSGTTSQKHYSAIMYETDARVSLLTFLLVCCLIR